MTHKTHTDHGHRFNVRIVEVGEAYGRDDCLTNDSSLGAMVEFYDGQQSPEKFGELGQFVARYYLSTLTENHQDGRGLCLDAGIPEWSIGPAEYADHFRWILEQTGGIEA